MKTWGCPGGLLHGYTVVSRLVAAMKRDRLSTTRPRGTRRRRARAGQELQASTNPSRNDTNPSRNGTEENVRAKCANLPWGSRGPHSPRKQYLAIGRWRSFYLFNPGPSQKSGIDRATTRPRGVRRRRVRGLVGVVMELSTGTGPYAVRCVSDDPSLPAAECRV